MKLEEKIGALKDTDIALVVSSSESYLSTNEKLLKFLVKEKGLKGIYVTVNKPYSVILEVLEEDGIPTENLFFIDAISEDAGLDVPDEDRVVYLDSPQDLSDLSIAISEAVEEFGDERVFLFMDSLSTLTIYNDVGTISRFAHFIIGKLRRWDICGIIVSLEEEADRQLISRIGQFCDVTIREDD